MVSTVPSPSWSTAPPSSTKSNSRTATPASWRCRADSRVVGQIVFAAPAVGLEAEARCVPCPRPWRKSARCRAARYRHSAPARSPPRSPNAACAEASASAPFTSTRTALAARESAHHGRHVAALGLARSPFQSSGSAGQAVQIAFCGAHSGGTAMSLSISVFCTELFRANKVGRGVGGGGHGCNSFPLRWLFVSVSGRFGLRGL